MASCTSSVSSTRSNRPPAALMAAMQGAASAGSTMAVAPVARGQLAEAVWVFETDSFGPLIVTMDCHGRSLHDELEKLVTLYGCSNYQALKAATANPAEYIGLEGEKGRMFKRSPQGDPAIWWAIDPIDGTKSFVRRYPMFSTQIAVMQNGRLELGVVAGAVRRVQVGELVGVHLAETLEAADPAGTAKRSRSESTSHADAAGDGAN